MRLTIFTPTYNRDYTLGKLYHSLQEQTCFDFEWLIIDDGSTDNTERLVKEWMDERNWFSIRYIKTENCGKSKAHNRGAKEARGDLFINVDSDDWLTNSAVEIILNTWDSHKDFGISGMIAFRGFPDGSCRTMIKNDSLVEVDTLYNLFTKTGLKGDMVFVLTTENLKKHSFPWFDGEKFVPEGYLYIDMFEVRKKLCLVRSVIYLGDYLDDGLTKSDFKHIASSPLGYKAYCYKRFEWHKRLKEKFVDAIRLDAILFYLSGRHIYEIFTNYLFVIAIPLGWLMYMKRFRKWRKGGSHY